MNPGACLHELAVEVYTIAVRITRRKYGRNTKHAQRIEDAVGEAFVRWYASASDKSAHAAIEHARYLAKTAGSHLSDTNPCKRKTARAIACIASHDDDQREDGDGPYFKATTRFEATLRRYRGAPTFADCEDNTIDAIDAILDTDLPPGAAEPVMRLAIDTLKRRHWTDRTIAAAIGVAHPMLSIWRSGRVQAPLRRRQQIVGLARSRAFPPVRTPAMPR